MAVKKPFPVRAVALPQPGIGASLQAFQLDPQQWVRVESFFFTFSADANAANRQMTMFCGDGQGGVLWQAGFQAGVAHTANTTAAYLFARHVQTWDSALALGALSSGNTIAIAIGHGLVPPGHFIGLAVTALQAGDAILSPRVVAITLDARPARTV